MEVIDDLLFLQAFMGGDAVYQIPDKEQFVVWIVCNEQASTSEQIANSAFLEKILGAVNLNSYQYRISNFALPAPIDYRDQKVADFQQIWCFGNTAQLFPAVQFQKYEWQMVSKIHYLQADSLGTIQADVALKKQLWEALKKMV